MQLCTTMFYIFAFVQCTKWHAENDGRVGPAMYDKRHGPMLEKRALHEKRIMNSVWRMLKANDGLDDSKITY